MPIDAPDVLIPVGTLDSFLLETLHALRIEQGFGNVARVLLCIEQSVKREEVELLQQVFQQGVEFFINDNSKNLGPAFGRNKLAEQATSSWLIFMDSDVRYSPGVLEILWSRLKANSVLAGVRVLPSSPRPNSVEVFFERHVFVPRNFGFGPFFPSAFWAVRRDVFNQVEGFNEFFPDAAGEDWEFLLRFFQRIKRQDYDVSWHADLSVVHRHPSTIMALIARAARYGWNAHLYVHQLPSNRPWIVRVFLVPFKIITLLKAVVSEIGLGRVVPGEKYWAEELKKSWFLFTNRLTWSKANQRLDNSLTALSLWESSESTRSVQGWPWRYESPVSERRGSQLALTYIWKTTHRVAALLGNLRGVGRRA